MGASPIAHPSADALRAFALGKLNEVSASAVISHLDNCADCCKEVAAMTSDDFLARLRQAHGPGSAPAPTSPARPAALPNLPPELANNPQYEILRELGRGGMGVVYLAKNKPMDRMEVLKVITKSLLDRPGAVERFLREIRSAAQLHHTNVVTAYSVLQLGELLAFAMEYVEGEDLAKLVKARSPLPVPAASSCIQQAALGLQHAHEKKMVHRDIKPHNLMLAREGKKAVVKILDFGLAKATRAENEDTGLTGEGAMLGTPDYIAPEQALDAARADIRADIYSLGCTLYYLLTGAPPFQGKSLSAVLLAHQSMQARPLNLVRPEAPEELAAVVRKMMAKEPAKRYQTPAEVVQALAMFARSGVTGAPPNSTCELSVGTDSARAKIAKPERPVQPAARTAKPNASVKEAPPPVAWDTLTEEGNTSIPARKSGAVRKRRSPAGRAETRKKWLIGGGIGLGVLLLALLGMWANGLPKENTTAGDLSKESPDGKPAKLPNSITNSIGMKLVLVKPGTFLMGSPPDEAGRSDDEHQHEVEITRSFYVGVYEVTQEQYERVMGQNPSWFSSTGDGKDKVQGMDTRTFPVESVSWDDAVEFCRRLSELPAEKANESTYRLPTEAEWEYSCRGGPLFKKPSPPFYFGDSLSATQANFDGNYPYGGAAKGQYLECPTKVGSSYPPNSLGLYNLHGNVWEWCSDWYDAEYYQHSPRLDPQGPANGKRRVLRGGSWVNDGRDCRAAYRNSDAPGLRYIHNGFRVVLVVGART
jgi:formylglycine-generating enzyme required for sulfatase activity